MSTRLNLVQSAQPFLEYLQDWMTALPVLQPDTTFAGPQTCAILSVDVEEGFCSLGPLASPRVAAIAPRIASLLEAAWTRGVRHMALLQDTHDPQAVEFSAWPPHCISGTDEAKSAAALRELPFYDQLPVIPKNSISSNLNTGLEAWLAQRPQLKTFVVVGDCTDLCTYQLAMFLRMDANARQLDRRVIVPADCVDTYDYTLNQARINGGLPHPGDLMHAVFLYHMALNGIEVVASIR